MNDAAFCRTMACARSTTSGGARSCRLDMARLEGGSVPACSQWSAGGGWAARASRSFRVGWASSQ
eukprot:3079789-Prymnesium_polylepis.1